MQGQALSSAPFTLQQAIEAARTKNPILLSGREHLSATRANEITAKLRQNPSFTVGGQNLTLDSKDPGGPYMYTANVSRLFERGNKRQWRTDVAQQTSAVTESQLRDQERAVLLSVKQAFTTMLLAKEGLRLSEENLKDFRHQVDLSQERRKAGDISQTDFERIDLQLASFERDTEQAKLSLLQASDQLQALIGAEKPDPKFDITGSLSPPAISYTLDQLLQGALTSRPDYQAAVQAIKLAEANVHLADANAKVDPTLSAEYERNGSDNTVGGSINIPLRFFDRNQGEKQRTRFEAQAARLAATAVRAQVFSDVDQAWAGLQTATAQSQRYSTHYLEEAKRVRDNLEFSYRRGAGTLLDYLDALRAYRQTNLDALSADAQVWLSLHQLSYASATEIVQ